MSTSTAPPTACTAVDADVCIIGAGLSGAYAAHTLLSRGQSVAVLDARHRIGGRLLTAEAQGGGDLGGAWVWPRSEFVMQSVLRELDVPTVPMHLSGETAVRASNGERHVIPDGEAGRYAACGGGAVRVAGGASTIVQKLLQSDEDGLSVHLETRVVRIEHNDDRVQIIGAKSQPGEEESISISCRAAILAAPPKVLASTIEFDPPLPQVKEESMRATPTWMEDYGKMAVSFPHNWWRGMNLSAISVDQVGAVSTWWEACSGVDGDGTKPTLAGFVTVGGARKLQNMETTETTFDHIINSLGEVYGIDKYKMGMQNDATSVTISGSPDRDGLIVSKGGITITYKSWLGDSYTYAWKVEHSFYPRDYGDKDLKRSVGRLFFAGTETALGHGHMEGAVVAAQRAADEVMSKLTTNSL